MATLRATTASNCPRIAPDSIDAVQAIISDYEFPGLLRELVVEVRHSAQSDEDDSRPRLAIRADNTFDATTPIENADGDVVDHEHGHTKAFLERLAPHLEECLVVETVSHEKCRFPLLASQWAAWPDGTIQSSSFDHHPEYPEPRADDPTQGPPLHSLSETARSHLAELATYGDRRYLLWELASNGQDFCGVEFLVAELGLDDTSVSERVERFVDDLQTHSETYFEGTDWPSLEATWGHIVDAYLPDEPPLHHQRVSESHEGDR